MQHFQLVFLQEKNPPYFVTYVVRPLDLRAYACMAQTYFPFFLRSLGHLLYPTSNSRIFLTFLFFLFNPIGSFIYCIKTWDEDLNFVRYFLHYGWKLSILAKINENGSIECFLFNFLRFYLFLGHGYDWITLNIKKIFSYNNKTNRPFFDELVPDRNFHNYSTIKPVDRYFRTA